MLGPDHPHVATSYCNIGSVYYKQGKLEEAMQYCRQALCILRKAFGDHHPDVAKTKLNIGLVLEASGKAGEARAMFAEAAAVRHAMLGPDHPLTMESEQLATE